MLSVFLFLLSLVTLQTDVYNKSTGRCFLSVAAAGVVFYAFWGRNGVLIYNVLFDRDAYLEKFNDELRRLPSDLERYTTVCSTNICFFILISNKKTYLFSLAN